MTVAQRVRQYLDEYRVALDARHAGPALVAVVAMMLLSAALDLLGVGLVAPFVARVLGQPVDALPAAVRAAANGLSLTALGAVIVAVFAGKSVLAYRLQRRIVYFSERHRARLMTRLLSAYLAKPYEFHLQRSASGLINTLFWHTAHYSGSTLASSLRLLTDGLVLVLLVTLLWTISALATSLLLVFLGVVFVTTAWWVRHEYTRIAVQLAESQRAALAAVQNSIGAFREIRVLGSADVFRDVAATAAGQIADAAARQNALNTVPKAAVEFSLVSFLVVLSLMTMQGGQAAQVLAPVLGAMAVAGMRLVPIATALLGNLNNLRSSRLALREIAIDLRAERVAKDAPTLTSPSPPEQFEAIRWRDVSYRYPGAVRDSLERINLRVARGQVLGIRGRSGAGKSTLVDLLLGLLEPTSGTIEADGRAVSLADPAWHHRCAYIPQDVFLITGSVRDNILFGSALDEARLQRALQRSRVDAFLPQLVAGLDSHVGERGISLSGGQRQRIAIARALYHDRDVLVMDEATSALDSETEDEIIAAVRELRGDRTVVLVAHRERMLAACDRVIALHEGRNVHVADGVEVE